MIDAYIHTYVRTHIDAHTYVVFAYAFACSYGLHPQHVRTPHACMYVHTRVIARAPFILAPGSACGMLACISAQVHRYPCACVCPRTYMDGYIHKHTSYIPAFRDASAETTKSAHARA